MITFYICIGMLLISLSCWCKSKYSGKYSFKVLARNLIKGNTISIMNTIYEDDPGH